MWRLKIFRSFNCGHSHSGEAPEKIKKQRNPKPKANQPSLCVFLQLRCGSLWPQPAGCHRPWSPWRAGWMACGPRFPQFLGQLGNAAAARHGWWLVTAARRAEGVVSPRRASDRHLRGESELAASWRAVSDPRGHQEAAPRPVGVGGKQRMRWEIPAADSGLWPRWPSFVLQPKQPFLFSTSQDNLRDPHPLTRVTNKTIITTMANPQLTLAMSGILL